MGQFYSWGSGEGIFHLFLFGTLEKAHQSHFLPTYIFSKFFVFFHVRVFFSSFRFNTTFRVGQTPLPGDSTSKFRRRTAVPEELLFSQTNKPEVQEQQFFPVVSNHNVNNNVENNLSTNYNITKVPSASSVLK